MALCDALEFLHKEAQARKRRIQYNEELARQIEVPQWDKYDYRLWFEQRYQTENNREFIYNDDNQEIIDYLCMYFASDKDFESISEGFSMQKGILLIGGVGVGKTSIMKAFRTNPHKSFGVVKCQHIVNTFLNTDNVYLRYTIANRNIASSQSFGQEYFGWCYDDLGEENEANKYGNKFNVMADVLDRVYNDSELKGICHVTTNMNGEQVEELYGARIRSRMRAMFNVITFPSTAKDMRR